MPYTVTVDPARWQALPSLPVVMTRALSVIHDPKSSSHDLEEVVVQDKALTSAVLRLANSAFYGFAGRVTTVSQAATLLGFKEMEGLVLSMGVFKLFVTRSLSLHDLWKHSIATGMAARFLAPPLGCLPAEAFTAGVLHDLGKLALIAECQDLYSEVIHLQRSLNSTSIAAERAVLRVTHVEVGDRLAEQWGLPDKYADVVAHHHTPSEARCDHTLCRLIGAANYVAHVVLPGAFSWGQNPKECLELVHALGLQPKTWQRCLEEIANNRDSIHSFLTMTA